MNSSRCSTHLSGSVSMSVSLSLCALVAMISTLSGCVAEDTSATDEQASEDGDSIDVTSQELKAKPLSVSFNDCSELASITTISVAKARTVVPSSFKLAGDANGAPFVVRVANCAAVSIDGGPPEAGTVAQLGISLVPPDGTGDINNYTAWYYTTSRALSKALRRQGVPAQWVPNLRYQLTGGTLTIDAQRPAEAPFHVTAPVVEPNYVVPFQANWWVQNGCSRTKMSTPIPSISFGSAKATLTTPPKGQLARLLGSSTATFALLDSFNRFATAPMTVTVTRP